MDCKSGEITRFNTTEQLKEKIMSRNDHAQYDKQDFANTLRKLKRLKNKIFKMSCYQERVEFAYIILKCSLYKELLRDDGLLAQAGLTERHFDTCFEMGDSDAVFERLFYRAKFDNDFANAFKEHLSEEYYHRSMQECSNLVFNQCSLL